MTKKISLSIFILAMMIAFALDAYKAEALPVMEKTWHYEYTEAIFNWAFQYQDEYDGLNYQCTIPNGNQCGQWDWKAIYPLNISYDPGGNPIYEDPCPGNNNPEYGHGLVVGEAGALAPPYLPSFSIVIIE